LIDALFTYGFSLPANLYKEYTTVKER
jgi:hypothetical protein